VRRGTLVDINDPTVKPPVLIRQPAVAYPETARQARVEGDVELKALVDENGNVLQVTLVRTTRPGYRFELEADRHVRGRRYRPATKDGVAVRVWMPILVKFTSTR
jgi:protein TonB